MRGKKPAPKKKPQLSAARSDADRFRAPLREFRSLLLKLRLSLLDLQNLSRNLERTKPMPDSAAVATAPDQPPYGPAPEQLTPGDLLKRALAEFEARTHFGEPQQALFARIKGLVYQKDPGPLCVYQEGVTEPLPPPTPEEVKALEDAATPPESAEQKLLAEGEPGAEAANTEAGSSAEASSYRRRRREQSAEGEQKVE